MREIKKMKILSLTILLVFIFSSFTSIGIGTGLIRPLPTIIEGHVLETGTTTAISGASVQLRIRSMDPFNFGEIIYEQYRATDLNGYYIFEDAVAGIKDLTVTKAEYSTYIGAYIDPVYLESTGYQYTIYGSIMDGSDLVSNAYVEITDGSTTHSTTTQNDGYYSMTFSYETSGIKEFDIEVTHNDFDDYYGDLTMNTPGYLQHNPQLPHDNRDLKDLRIEDLHEIGITGEDITICIIDTDLGYVYSPQCEYGEDDYRNFPVEIYEKTNGDFREMYFHDMDWLDSKSWDGFSIFQNTRKTVWKKIAKENCFSSSDDYYLHGTQVFSVITQIAPDARYVYIEIEGWSDLPDALDWLIGRDYLGIDIISFSGGGYYDNEGRVPLPPYSTWFPSEYVSIQTKINTLADDGIIFVASSGNENFELIYQEDIPSNFDYKTSFYPASFENVIGVGGTNDRNHELNSWLNSDSNYGYGIDIYSIYDETYYGWDPDPSDDYVGWFFSGTSNACPIVAGIIAIVEGYYQSFSTTYIYDLTVSTLQTILKETGDPFGYSPASFEAYNENENTIHGAYSTNNPYDELEINWNLIDGQGSWGIIDAYEIYLYISTYLI